MKKLLSLLVVVLMLFSLVGCSSSSTSTSVEENGETVFKVGICNFVDDASLNQIIENIETQLKSYSNEPVKFEVEVQNCNTDAAVLEQIIADFINGGVDLMVGVATPVAMAMQAATEDNQIPVVFAAVSDPVACGVVESLDNPGANITGTSDFLDTKAVLNLMLAQDPDMSTVGLLYDKGQDSSTTAIKEAKEYLAAKGIEVKEYTGTNTTEVQLAVSSIVADGLKAVFTPSDNTIMAAELSIYEELAKGGVKHYAGADSFALNGAFVGYGVDYANLGKETGKMVYDILVNGKDVSSLAVKTFENGIATVNTDVVAELGLSYEDVKNTFAPLCTEVKEIVTAESFN